MKKQYNCRICGIGMDFGKDVCIHCDWYLGEGYTEEGIKEIIRKTKNIKLKESVTMSKVSDKMDEMILAVARRNLFEEERTAFQGIVDDPNIVNSYMKKFNKYIEVRRGDAEGDSSLKQPIPYTILRRGDQVFLYKRLSKGGETRLHDQLSIGVGGHMNRVNDVKSWNSNLLINMYREINEELEIISGRDLKTEPEIIGLINDDENEVGRHHICILTIIDLPEHADVKVKETDTLEGCWVRINDLKKTPLFESLETWSQIAAEVFMNRY